MNLLAYYVFTMLSFAAVQQPDSVLYPQNYFKAPLDIELTLAGNFCEPRRLHFHTGLDFKTNNEEGHPVFASADGYISRINVSASGYGNALYITHPNGYVTLYGHLQQFAPALQERLRKEQYAKKMFAVDFELKPNEFVVKQGDTIALSGNTGASGGPHLHFEIRDSAEHALNPLLFGLKLKDDVKPTVNLLKIYALDSLKYKTEGRELKLVLKDSVYEPAGGLIKVNASAVGVAVNTFDLMSQSVNHVGVYSIKMYVDSALSYQFKMNRMGFTENRCVLSHIDYSTFVQDPFKTFNRCYIQPGNLNEIYNRLAGNGVIMLNDGKEHAVLIEVSDYAGNVSRVQFKLVDEKSAVFFKPKETKLTDRLDCNKPNVFQNEDIKIDLPKNCLFDTVYLSYYSSLPTDAGIFSKIHALAKSSAQVYNWFNIAVKPEKLPINLRDKAVVVFKDAGGNEVSRGGRFDGGFVATRAREFGAYYLRIDTTPPLIAAVNANAKSVHREKKLIFKISDNLSGIDGFNTYLDGAWVITQYDAKNMQLTYAIDPALTPGEHLFKVEVTDERKNVAQSEIKFKW